MGRRAEAADSLLEVMQRDRSWRDDAARLQLLKLFEAWDLTTQRPWLRDASCRHALPLIQDPRPPRDEALPTEFPIFPLPGALLLPRGRLPLNIFEPRYLALVDEALAAGRMFGMVQPNPKLEPDKHGPGLFSVGCLGRLSSFSETDDGRYLITLTGVIRFEVAAELPGRRGFRRVRAGLERFTAVWTCRAAARVSTATN